MSVPMSVNKLLQGFAKTPAFDVKIKGLSLDSRQIKKDYAFVALQGAKAHGMDFAKTAIAGGANSIIFETSDNLNLEDITDIRLFPVENLTKNISKIAGRFYKNPSDKLKVIAITGTNGKSSIAYGLADILNKSGRKSTVIGTVGFTVDDKVKPATHTTPDAISLQALLAEALGNQSEFLVMEASSHGLAQYRLDGVKLDTAIYTNLSRDHQDFHPDMTHYADSKERLFKMSSLKSALININDEFGAELATKYKNKLNVIVYGLGIGSNHAGKYLNATAVNLDVDGLRFKLESSWGDIKVKAHIFGKFNIENLLAIIGACLLADEDLTQIVTKLEDLTMVAGRMQSFKADNMPLVVVDYAHTPDALLKALKALREHVGATAKILCVFGCGGDRDKGKRPIMGAAVENNADLAIITDDNPRSEDSSMIINNILSGFTKPQLVQIMPDRKQAILFAIDKAQDKDVVLVAGKGHETEQIIGDERLYFSDAEVVQEALC